MSSTPVSPRPPLPPPPPPPPSITAQASSLIALPLHSSHLHYYLSNGHTTTSYLPSVSTSPPSTSFLQILKQSRKNFSVITFSKSLDDACKVAESGMVTMISGAPGVGKSQLCMQLSVNALVPQVDGGVGGATLYISTEGVPDTIRMSTMLQKLQNHVNKARHKKKSPTLWNDSTLLEKIGIAQCNDMASLMKFLKCLPTMARERGYKLIILDSIASPIRCMEDNMERMRATLEITSLLSKVASSLNIAIVCTNHLTTPFKSDDNNLIPALGLSISSQFDVHIELSKSNSHNQGEEILAKVKKGAKEGTTAMYLISDLGIRDIKRKKRTSTGNPSSST